jgi:enolase
MNQKARALLERGWVIANHKLVSFHAAFISSVLNLPEAVEGKLGTLRFMFLSYETIISAAILYLSWHVAIAVHELGHYATAGRVTALNRDSQEVYEKAMAGGFGGKFALYARAFLTLPWGRFDGVKKDEGNYAPDAPYNLAVAASGPVASAKLAAFCLPAACVLIAVGLITRNELATYGGRFLFAPGVVGLLDRFLADRGKLKEFRTREKLAREQAGRAAEATAAAGSWLAQVKDVKERLLATRIQEVELSDGSKVRAPWQFRNCAMGGRHTEKEYPESNISMQESMFIPLSATTYEEAQEMTVRLQTRLKEILESAPGAKVMGVGLEGGLAPYIDKEPSDRVPEQRLWRLMKQTILDSQLVPGVDVAIALDPAASELENAYRQETGQKDAVGMYRFWRDKSKIDMSRDEVFELYRAAMEEGVPILSVEDGFGELDHEGWKLIMRELGDKVFVIGDDLVTTKDSTIEETAKNGEINATLIKANQIGTLSETVLAMLTSLAYGAELVVSHRSKSPNDPFEADISTAMNTLGIKAGGGANTERLQKYGRVMEILALAKASKRETAVDERAEVERLLGELVSMLTGRGDVALTPNAADVDVVHLLMGLLAIEAVSGTEEATNAGIPSAAATVFLGSTGTIRFKGSTPLGTSAGGDEAIHYVDSIICPCGVTSRHPGLFDDAGDGTYRFRKGLDSSAVQVKGDPELNAQWKKSRRYGGKGCMDAVSHIETVLAKAFTGRRLSQLGTLLDVDRELLKLELETARSMGRFGDSTSEDERIHLMQRKGVLGMNAILSLSLALGRAIAAREGKELWQLIREMAVETMTRFVMSNGGDAGGSDPEQIRNMDFDDLKAAYRQAAQKKIKGGGTVYQELRRELPVYEN